MKTNEIKKLEKKYFDKIVGIFDNPKSKFKQHLMDLEAVTIKDYNHYNNLWGKKNKIEIAVERMLRFHLYRNTELDIVDVYTSPLSTDIAIELEKVILCIDAKTVDLYGNLGDESSIAIQKNQITFNNKPESGRFSDDSTEWPGLAFPPQLEKYFKDSEGNEKPCLTYFINFYYEDDGSSFKLSHMNFCCVPHYEIAKEPPFNNQLAQNFKSWSYIEDDTYGQEYLPIDENDDDFEEKKRNWHPKSGTEDGEPTIVSYVDTGLFHPMRVNDYCLWKSPEKDSGIWKIALWGGSARIYKHKLLDRHDHEGYPWKGVKEFRIGAGHSPNYKITKEYWGQLKANEYKGDKEKTESRQKEIDVMIEIQGETN